MKLTLYNNFSENNKLDKIIHKIVELEGSLLDSTSIINPGITIFFKPEDYDGYVVDDNKIYITFNGIKITWGSFIYNYVLSANYAKIDDFNRYYFISDIVSVRTNLWRLSLNCDVLMSYKTPLLKLNALIARNEFDYNSFLFDNRRSMKYDKEIIEYKPNMDGVSGLTKFDVNATHTSNIVLSILTNWWLTGTFNVTPPNSVQPKVSSESTGYSCFNNPRVISPTTLASLAGSVVGRDDYKSYIAGITVYPFDITTRTTVYDEDLYFMYHGGTGDVKIEDIPNKSPFNVISDYLKVAEFKIEPHYNNWMDYDPYTKYEIYIPYLSYIQVSAEEVLGKTLQLVYVVNYQDGTATASLINIDDNKVIYSGECQLGCKLAINSTNTLEIEKAKTANGLNLAIGLASSTIATAGGMATGNPLMTAKGVVGFGSSLTNFITTANSLFVKGQASVISGSNGVYTPQDVRIKITRCIPVTNEDDYKMLEGLPLNEYRNLSDLHGFTVVSNIHLENVASATTLEHNNLKTLLEEGIIL